MFRLWFALAGSFFEPPFFQKRPVIKMIKMIKMIEMFRPPLAGSTLHWGAQVGGRVGDIWDVEVLGSGGGYGFCLCFGEISKKCNPCFVGRPVFLICSFPNL